MALFFLTATAICVSAIMGLRASGGDRTISIFNIHTKDTTTVTFRREGAYDQAALEKLNYALRDWRVDEVVKIDPALFDLLWELHSELKSNKPIHLISGHRSDKTNEMLRRTRGGQAKKSLHIQGMASDVYFPDVPLERLRNAALVRQRGGVGYYPRSGQPFVHVDTGRVRHWPAIPETELAAIMGGRAPASIPPAKAVREVVVAAAETATESSIVAPRPRFKPDFIALGRYGEPDMATTEEGTDSEEDGEIADAAPLRFADAGESSLLPSLRPVRDAVLPIATAARDWGQSWLLPSASPQPVRLSPVDAAGASRVVVTANHAAEKGDAPLQAGYALSYANAAGDRQAPRAAGLLGSGADDLARLLAEARLIDGQAAMPPAGATELRPAVLLHHSAEEPSRPRLAPPPVMTASLGPAMREPLPAPRQASALVADFGGMSLQPRIAPEIRADANLVAALLRAPASNHAVTFGSWHGENIDLAGFAPASYQSLWSTGAPRAETGGVAGDIVAFAERAIGWIFGN